MTSDSLLEIRENFQTYEKMINGVQAVDYLHDALDLVLDLLNDDTEDPNTKQIAKNLALTYRKPIIEKARNLDLDRGSHDFDLYEHWHALAQEYAKAGFGEDSDFKSISVAFMTLAVKKTMSSEEQAELVQSLRIKK